MVYDSDVDSQFNELHRLLNKYETREYKQTLFVD
jgi:hypothetical protein